MNKIFGTQEHVISRCLIQSSPEVILVQEFIPAFVTRKFGEDPNKK